MDRGGIENGNFEEFIARQKTFIKRCSEGGIPLTDRQQVDQLFTALKQQREINIKSIKDFFYDAYSEREQQTFELLATKIRHAWNNRTTPAQLGNMAVTSHVAAVNSRAMTSGEIKISIRELQQDLSQKC